MFPRPFSSLFGSSSLRITTILNGLNKFLNIANKAIPLYQKASPYIKNINSLKNILTSSNKQINQNTKISNAKKSDTLFSKENQPTFFN